MLVEYVMKRRLDAAFSTNRFRTVINGTMSPRSNVSQHAATLLLRAGYARAGRAICDASVDLCRRRTEIWRRKVPNNIKDVDAYIATLKQKSSLIWTYLVFLTAVAVRLGDPMVDLLLSRYSVISKENSKAWHIHYESIYKKNTAAGFYEAPIEPWVGFASIGNAGSDNLTILRKLARVYMEESCLDAIRGLAFAEISDDMVWKALSSAALAGDQWAIEALARFRDERALSVFEELIGRDSHMFEETAIALAEGIANFDGQRPTQLLTQLLAKRSGREDKFVQAVGDAFAQIGESSGIPVLLGELEKLKRTFGAYPECLVKKNDPFVFTQYRSSDEASERSVGAITVSLGRLGALEVKDTISQILQRPVQTVHTNYGISTWTVTHSPWIMYQSTLAARVYGDPKLVPALEQLLRHANALVRYGSVTALEAFTPKNYRKGFLPLIADKESLVRRAAVRGQGKTVIGTSELSGIEPIVLRLGDAVEDVRSAAITAILAIGAPAVPVLKEHMHSKDSWLRAGVLVCLAQLAEVSDIGQLNTFSGDTMTIQITREVVTANDHSNSLVALNNAWIETIRARKIVRQVHFVFQPPSDEEYRRAIRRWVSELDQKFPQITCILTDQALSAWLKLLLPDRKDKVQENQTSDEPAGGGSRAGLLLDLVERSRGASREICKTNWFRRRRTERELINRLFHSFNN